MSEPRKNADAGPTLRSPYNLLDEPAITVPEFLLQHAEFHVRNGKGQQPWLIDSITGDSYTFADFIRISSNVANWFYANGMRRGDTVIFMPINFTKMHFVIVGTWRANGVLRASYPEDTAETLLDRVEESKAKWIYCESTEAEHVLGVVAQCDWPIQVIVNGTAENCISVDDVMHFEGKESPKLEVTPDDPALILCTSGTTGKPKGAARTHRSVVNIFRIHAIFPWGEKPLFVCKGVHLSGATRALGNLVLGKTTVIVWRLTTKDIFEGIDKHKPDYVFSFPTFIMAMVSDAEVKNYDFSSIKQIMTTGVVISSAIADKIMQLPHLERIITMYGLTETAFSIANVRYSVDGTWEVFNAPPGSVGVVLPGREIQIRDQETGKVLGPGHKGEICIKSGDMFSHYVNNPQATKDSFTEDGYFKSGDIGSYDQNGCITVFGRAKEVFKCSGNHVSPGYLDEVISQHPAVSEACTVGIILEDAVEAVPRAFVTLKAGHEGTTATEIMEFAHGKLANYMHLRGGLYIAPQLPRGPTGKVTRKLVGQLKVD